MKEDDMEVLKHANWIEYLANKNIQVTEKKDAKTGEKFLHLSKPVEEKLKRKIINHLLREYDDVESINRAIEDYRFENGLEKKKSKK
jgi:hypothetical protein